MPEQRSSEMVGDNIEFTAVNIGDYTIHLNESGPDSEFVKYAQNNPITARRIRIRNNQTILQVGENGIEFTNPMTITVDKGAVEKRDVFFLNQIVLRTTVVNTSLKIRWN